MEIYTPSSIKTAAFNIRPHIAGYYSLYDLAVERIKYSAEIKGRMEEEGGWLDPDELFLCFILEKKELDNSSPYKNHGRWLFNRKGELIDYQVLDDYKEEMYDGRPKEHIRFKRGDIVQHIDIGDRKSYIGIVSDVPPTKDEIKDYNMRHPFLAWVGEEDCYQVEFSRQRGGMCSPVNVIAPLTQVPADIINRLKRLTMR